MNLYGLLFGDAAPTADELLMLGIVFAGIGAILATAPPMSVHGPRSRIDAWVVGLSLAIAICAGIAGTAMKIFR